MVLQLLPQLRRATRSLPLQQDMLYAGLTFVHIAQLRRGPVPYQHLDETSGELAFVLTDTLRLPCIDPTNEANPVSPDDCIYSKVGLEAVHQRLVHYTLLGRCPACVKGGGSCLYFWKRAMPHCCQRLRQHIDWMLSVGLGGRLNIGPYLDVLGKWSRWVPEDCVKPPPAEAALLTLQVLYMLVQTFWKQQVSIKGKTPGRMTNSTKQAASQEAASLEQAAEATRALIDSILEAYGRIRDDRQWGAVIAGLEDNSWLATKEQAAAAFKRKLSILARTGTRLLPASVVRRLLACFSPLVLDQPDKTEATALTDFNELWNHEQQAADRAAAKKAKKVQKQQAQSSLALSPSLGDLPANRNSPQNRQEPSQIGQEPSSVGQEPSTSGQEFHPSGQATSVAHQLFRPEDEASTARNRPSHASSSTSQLPGDRSLVQADSDQHASAAPPLATTSPVRPLSETMSEAVSPTGVDVSNSCDALTVSDRSHQRAERQAGHGGTGPAVAPRQDAGDHTADKDVKFLHNLFCCPITKVLMVEPVIAADGHTYEKAAIETWLQQHTISPVTGDFLAHTCIVPNVLIKSAIGTNQGL